MFSLVGPLLLSGRLVKTHEASSQEPHSFRGTLPRNSYERAQVPRKAPDSLLEHGAKDLRFECEWAQILRVQAVKGVVAPIIVLIKPIAQSEYGFKNLLFTFCARVRDCRLVACRGQRG